MQNKRLKNETVVAILLNPIDNIRIVIFQGQRWVLTKFYCSRQRHLGMILPPPYFFKVT
jgi:hypothetical protein